jgi:tetratricopeptide (TPR) repeat protein
VATDPITWFTVERLNLMEATRQACAQGRHQFAAELAARQAAFQFFQGRLDDAEQLWRLVIAAAGSAGDPAAVAHAELQLVQFTAERGKNAEALVVLQRCVRVFEQRGDQRALALALHWRAYCAEEQNLLQVALGAARQGIEVARRVGDRHSELSSLRVLGVATTQLGDHDAGIAACEDALTIARELREPYAEFECLHALAYTNIRAARHGAAIGLCLQGEEMARTLGYAVGEAYALGPLGDVYHAVGRYNDAIGALTRAQRIFQDRGMQRGSALCLLKIALAYQALGHYQQAADHLKASLPTFRELHLPTYEERALHALRECGYPTGDHAGS